MRTTLCLLTVAAIGMSAWNVASTQTTQPAATSTSTTAPSVSSASQVFADDFDKVPSPAWSIQAATSAATTAPTTSPTSAPTTRPSRIAAETSPAGKRFLGRFSNDTVTLSLTKLPRHAMIRIQFDLLLVRTWSGNSTEAGPNIWELSLTGGPTLLRATFSNVDFWAGRQQSFPDWVGRGSHPPRTGAADRNVLGYKFIGPAEIGSRVVDSVYHMQFTLPHSADDAAFEFSASGLDNERIATWGLADVSVSVFDAPSPLADATVESCWDDLAADNAERAYDAIWRLIGAGDQATTFLQSKLADSLVDLAALPKLIKDLDNDDWKTRDKATDALTKMGKPVEPTLKDELAKTKSLEVQVRLEEILKAGAAKEPTPAENQRLARAAWVLRVVRTDKARELLKHLVVPEPPNKADNENKTPVPGLPQGIQVSW